MFNKGLSLIMIMALVLAVAIGLFFQQTYTNVTAEENVMENFSVALWDVEMSPTLIEVMKEDLPNSNLIIRAKSEGKMGYTFKNNKQYVEVLEVYQGDELKAGDQIAVTSHWWLFFFENMSANMGFINVMQPDNEYLIFLEGKLETDDPKEDNIYLLPDLIVNPIFNYQDKKHTIVEVPLDYTYVPYTKVKDNEFFVTSEEALKALMEVKHEFLQKYPR